MKTYVRSETVLWKTSNKKYNLNCKYVGGHLAEEKHSTNTLTNDPAVK